MAFSSTILQGDGSSTVLQGAGPSTTIDTTLFPTWYTYGTTTITATSVPTPTVACDSDPFEEEFTPDYSSLQSDSLQLVYIRPVNNQTLGYMLTCCQGAPILTYEAGCSMYCGSSSLHNNLTDCFQPNGQILDGIDSFGYIHNTTAPATTTTSSTVTSATSTTSTAKPSHTGGAAVKSGSTLLSLAAGALAISWFIDGFA